MEKLLPETPVSMLSGVGKTREKQLNKIGIYTLRDLVYYYPRAYENRGNIIPLKNAEHEKTNSFILTITTQVKSTVLKRGLTISKFRATDGESMCEIVFFNSPFVKDVFHIGSTFRFYGKALITRNSLQLSNPKYDEIEPGKELKNLIPVYPLTDGISSKFIDKITSTALSATLPHISDGLPDDIRFENKLQTLASALKGIHFPKDEAELSESIRRLAFDEMLYFGLGISFTAKQKSRLNGIQFTQCDVSPLTSLLPYELTQSQKNAVNDIYKDTVFKDESGKSHPMARILVGDVGSGKTICAVYAMYICAKSSHQAALMAPTEILAKQHYSDIKKLFDKLSIKCELLLGSTKKSEKERIYNELSEGKIDVIIGTHALLSEKVNFKSLGLIVTDEQHRFGVMQRATLKDKSKAAHMLVMSATPIPRTLALTMYGDLDTSRITEMPKGRMKVDTFVVNESYRDRLNDFIKKQVLSGGQCYIVCPAIEKNEDEGGEIIPQFSNKEKTYYQSSSNIKNVVDFTNKLRQFLPKLIIECLHGKIKASEKDEIMARFSEGKIDILVSTTVIEVGVNVPNASLMVIENAERFGLSQLHQLRGRVGRGTRKSYCVLVSDNDSEKSKSRLEIMKTTDNGYEIAEKDLLLRGPGDFFNSLGDEDIRQSGGFEFKLAKMCDDVELFDMAFSAAKKIISDDPELKKEKNAALKEAVENHLTCNLSTIS